MLFKYVKNVLVFVLIFLNNMCFLVFLKQEAVLGGMFMLHIIALKIIMELSQNFVFPVRDMIRFLVQTKVLIGRIFLSQSLTMVYGRVMEPLQIETRSKPRY